MEINLRRVNSVLGKELRDLDIVPVLAQLQIILNQDKRLVRIDAHAIEAPVRSTLLDRRDLDLFLFETREVTARLF